jgi:hypothetical protein
VGERAIIDIQVQSGYYHGRAGRVTPVDSAYLDSVLEIHSLTGPDGR